MNSVVRPIFNIFKCVNSACTVHEQCMYSTWTMHALFINNKFCLWKSITIALKKKCASENADTESKPA